MLQDPMVRENCWQFGLYQNRERKSKKVLTCCAPQILPYLNDCVLLGIAA